ncbi:hypothetical protein MMC13_001869, partial [Lambiella insularis]|nr:hypothetical protein [Lambiella insularis]
ACLKDIPDNLIFHLKRFDYDVSTGMRSKINDNFEFPLEIDMSPYDVEYLKDPEHAATEDKFILVGILVHSGNAESGHYYSYIRERPANTRDECAWVEFNDADVVRFDPSNIPDQCYGGLAEPVAYPPMRYPKTWNAYMLFYQRSSSMELERQKHLPIVPAVPVKESIPLEMMPGIVLENELFIRKFCLFDPEHAKFVKQMLVHFRSFNSGLCSEDHALERRVIWMVLEHVDQIFSRTKDCPEFHTLMDMVAKAASTCPDCCKLTLDWIHHHDHALRNLLLRNPDEERRRKFSKMVLGALRFLREHDSTLYGVDVDNAEHDSMLLHEIPDIDGALQNMVGGLKELWSCLHLHCRAWDEYFELCTGIAQLGRLECAVLHRAAYLNHCLQLLIVDHNTASIKKLRFDIPYLGNYFRMLDKGRKFSFKYLLALLARLLECADFSMESTSDTYENDYQLPVSTGYPLSNMEENIIRFGSDMPRSKGLVFLDKAISGDHNILACQSIVRILTRAESDLELSNAIETTILHGITIDPSLGAKPYLMAALAFCEACTMTKFARHLVSNIALEVETIGCNGGDEHLEFFKAVRRIRNDNLMNAEPAFFYNLVLRYVPRWAPALLIYSDPAVRVETINLLHQLVFSFDTRSMDDEQKADEVNDIAKALCRACLKRITDYIIIPNKQIEASMVEEIVRVVRFCIGTYYQEEDEEEGPSLAVIESG